MNVDATASDNQVGDMMTYMQSEIKQTGIADKEIKNEEKKKEPNSLDLRKL